MLPVNQVLEGDCRHVMSEWPDDCIDMVMFSPPYYGLRDYGKGAVTIWDGRQDCDHEWISNKEIVRFNKKKWKEGDEILSEDNLHEFRERGDCACRLCGAWRGQLGLEPSWQMYITHMTEICHELKRVLKKRGSMYVNMGDTYAGGGQGAQRGWADYKRAKVKGNLKEPSPLTRILDYQAKCLMGMPWRLAFALIDDGWILRNDIIWHKPNAMPSSVKDRLSNTYEHIFHFTKNRKYYYDLDAIREPHKESSFQRAKYGESKPLKTVLSPDFKKSSMSQKQTGWNEFLAEKGINLNPLGKNRGDVYQGKFDGFGEDSEKYGSPRARTQRKQDHVPSRNAAVYRGFNQRWKESKRFDVYQEGIQPRLEQGKGFVEKWDNPRGKNPGDFWSITTKPFPEAHFAVYPMEICENPIKSGCPENGIVLDPMCGSGSTLITAHKLSRKWIGIEIVSEYVDIAKTRLMNECNFKLTEWIG